MPLLKGDLGRYSDGLRAGRPGFEYSRSKRFLSTPQRPDQLWGPPSPLSNGYGGSFSEVKRPGREADHSPLTSAEVKKMWIYTSTPPYAFMA
jgi:hypothetical protein